jgi:hypothetical protein
MKNLQGLAFALLVLAVVACSCPNLKDLEKRSSRTSDSPSAASTPSKSSSTGDVLTMEKFNRLKNGMKYEECVDIMGSEGSQTMSSGEGRYKVETYKWDRENFQFVMLTFMGGKLNSKVQNGLK